jgi:hypothetical protein
VARVRLAPSLSLERLRVAVGVDRVGIERFID